MCIIYLHVIESCLKVTIAMFFLAIRKILQMLWKIFSSPSLFIVQKNFLAYKCKKQVCYKEKKSVFFDLRKNSYIFPLKVCHFQYDHRFFFSREMGNNRAYKKVLLKRKNHLGRVFPSYFLQNVLTETSYVSYLVLCHFLMSWSLKIQNTLKDIISITFFNNKLQNVFCRPVYRLNSIWRPP